MDISNLAINFAITWLVGLSPALTARYLWRKEPLPSRLAAAISITSCIVLAFAFLIIRASLGGEERIGPVWILVALVSYWIMARGRRQLLIVKLRRMIADPATAPERKAYAETSLTKLGARGGAAQIAMPRSNWLSSLFDHSRANSLKSSKLLRYSLMIAAAAIILNVALILLGWRILINQQIVAPGAQVAAADWIYGHPSQSIIVCNYWTGRSTKPKAHFYGTQNNQVDECPAIAEPV